VGKVKRLFLPVFLVVGMLLFLNSSCYFAAGNSSLKDPMPGGKQELPVIGSYERLVSLLKIIKEQENFRYYGTGAEIMKSEAAFDAMAAFTPSTEQSLQVKDFSSTNVQVQGVDEADIVKTDGRYIYQVTNQKIVVLQAYPAEEMKLVSSIHYSDDNFRPLELYLDKKYLVVIGLSNYPVPYYKTEPAGNKEKVIHPPYWHRQTVKAIVYDIGSKTGIKKIREVELEGSYVSSRKINEALYLVANKGIDYYHIMESRNNNVDLTPAYRDTAGKGEFVSIGFDEIRYFPDFSEPSYMIIAGINLNKPDEQADISTYLGAGQNIYASLENLYVAVTKYDNNIRPVPLPEVGITLGKYYPPRIDRKTTLYKFALNEGKVTYKAKGEVPGSLLNQFSMDEYEGYFRVATTRGDTWRDDEFTSKNNVYILDENLNITGKLEDIAPGEKIYSVRFMGKRGYMVTFKTVDPLFVIDLSEPKNPEILGKLKIPGYSDYLHPYDENHIIGFGKDTIELSGMDNSGKTMAFYQGMKMAVFDVSDVNNPKEMYKEIIGDRGTDSEILRNHKALLFSREKNLLAFPVTVMEVRDKTYRYGVPAYGEFTFQGAYVYNIDLEEGFRLKGRISHLSDDDYLKSGGGWYNSERNVERVLYIEDTLYTLSKGIVKANRLDDLEFVNSVSF